MRLGEVAGRYDQVHHVAGLDEMIKIKLNISRKNLLLLYGLIGYGTKPLESAEQESLIEQVPPEILDEYRRLLQLGNAHREATLKPFVKWVGGKRQLLSEITQLLPSDIHERNYFEPFLGGGALLFHLKPKQANINDLNSELVNAYEVIRDNPDRLLNHFATHRNEADYFYQIRSWDRLSDFESRCPIERASRFLFLNRTCFNGLYRVNMSGEFNAPFGRYENARMDEANLWAVHHYLKSQPITLSSGTYREALASANDESFVYLDPPYHPLTDKSGFTGYVPKGWKESDQISLKETCDALDRKGVKFLLSNSCTPFIKELYKGYHIKAVYAKRSINGVGTGRGEVPEVLIRNYH